MKKIRFTVQDEAKGSYIVIFSFESRTLSTYCTCPDGIAGDKCQHITAILDGDEAMITSDNVLQVFDVLSWHLGSDVAAVTKIYQDLERRIAAIEQNTDKDKADAGRK